MSSAAVSPPGPRWASRSRGRSAMGSSRIAWPVTPGVSTTANLLDDAADGRG